MIWPAPPHCGQGWLIEKKPWLWASMPRPSQRGQVTGLVPGLAPLPWQVWQRSAFGTVTLICVAVDRLVEAQLDFGLEVAAAHRLGPGRGRPPPRLKIGEDVAEVGAEAALAPPAAGAERVAAAAEAGRRTGRRVVLLALLGIGEHVVRGGDLLELFLRRVVVRVAVRVVLARQFAVRLLDLVVGGVLRQPRASCRARLPLSS